MKTISNILKINLLLVLCVLYSVSALSQSSDFFVQHIQDDVPRTGANNTSFTPVSSLNNAVSLANNNRKTHAGRSDLNPANLNGDDMAGARSLTAVGTLTYYREGASINTDMRFNTSIWEYIGPVGGCNEMIVRGRYVVNLNGTTNSVTQALSGVLNANKCIPFITGIMNNDSSSGADSGTALAYLENATTLRVQKGTTSNNVSVYITVVEFTGSNWTVLHGDSGNTSGDSGTMTLRSGSDGTGTATSVSSWNEAMIFSHFRGDTSTSGTNQAISDLWPISDPGSNNQSVDWNFDGAHDSGGTNRHFVHVLNNPYLSVTRFQDTNNSDSNTNINIASAGLSNFNEALIIGSSVSSGGGTAYGRGWRNYYLNSITQAAHWAHRSGNSMAHEIQIIDLSGLTSQDINVVDSSSNAINDGSGNSPSVINDTEYGNVEIATSLAKTYTIENNGSCDLTISSITSSNAEFVVSSVPVTISGGGSGTFIITYNPSSIGINSATITINSNDPDSTEQIYTFTVQGTGEYCSSNGNNTSEEYIQNVQLNTINNTSGAGTTSTGYSNFTAQSTDLSLNSNYTITITPFWTGTIYDEAYSVWIDYNGDGDFSDAGEQVWTQSATTTTPVLGSFTIPITATLGSTRMRVSMKWNGIPTTCESFTYGEVEDYTVNIIGCITNTWTGTISADWNNTLNWSCGTIPTITTDVLIPTGVTNYPEIYSTDAAGLANNIELETGTSLIVYDNYIQIAGNLLLNGFIDLDGEGQLIQNTGSTLDNASTGYIEIDQQGIGNRYRYNQWSSPVIPTGAVNGSPYSIGAVLNDGTVASSPGPILYTSGYDGSTGPLTLSTYWMYKFTNSPDGSYASWFPIGSTGSLNPGEGYTMKGAGDPGAGDQNYVFIGKPNNGTITLTVGGNNDYLVGNPYPSAIDGFQFLIDNGPAGTGSIGGGGAIYFWEHYGGNSHNLKDYQAGYATLNNSGGVPATAGALPEVSPFGTPVKTPEQYIAIAQGFFVVADADGGTIEFNNGQRVFETESSGNSIFMKGEASKTASSSKTTADVRPKFRIGFEGASITHRQILFTVDENTSDAVDWGYEAEIYEMFDDDMFWTINDKKYVIQASNNVNVDKEIPLGIKSSGEQISIKVDALENVDESTELYIKDNVTGLTHTIKNQSFDITLAKGEYLNRFSLVFKPQNTLGVEEEILESGITVFMNNATSELQIKNTTTSEIESVILYNSLGQSFGFWRNMFSNETTLLPIKAASGLYFVQINTTTGKIGKKVIVE